VSHPRNPAISAERPELGWIRIHLRRSLGWILVLPLLILPTASAGTADAGTSAPPSLRLLRAVFRAGDEEGRSSTTLSEKSWKEVSLDRGWHSQDLGMPWRVGDRGWYRLWFQSTTNQDEHTWVASAGFVGNISELFVNGRRIGRYGSFEVNEVTGQRVVHAALIPPGLLQPGSNLFALRVLNVGGEGGILGGPVGIIEAGAFLPEWTHTELQREVMRIGLAALCFGWAAIPLLFRLVGDRTRILRGSAIPALLMGFLVLFYTQWWNSIDLGPLRPLLAVGSWLASGLSAAAIYGFSHNLGRRSRLWDIWAVAGLIAYFPVSLVFASDMVAFMKVYAGYITYMQVAIVAQCLSAPPERRDVARATLVGSLALAAGGIAVAALGMWPFLPFAALRWSPSDVSILVFLGLLAGSLLRGHVRARNAEVELGGRLITAHSEERRLIGRLLHDGVLQDLQHWRLMSDRSVDSGSAEELGRRLDAVSTGLGRSARDLRRVAEDLQPLATREESLEAALKTLAERLSQRHGVRMEVTVSAGSDVPDPVLETVYRVAQEAGGNACRHSGAEVVHLRVADSGGTIRLEVSDSGRGFNPGSVPEGHLGLRFLRDHAEWIGGRLEVESQPGSGARIVLEVSRPFRPR